MGCIFNNLYNIINHLHRLKSVLPGASRCFPALRCWCEQPNYLTWARKGGGQLFVALRGASTSGASPGLEDDGVTLMHWFTLHVSPHDKSASCGALSAFCALGNRLCLLCQEPPLGALMAFIAWDRHKTKEKRLPTSQDEKEVSHG